MHSRAPRHRSVLRLALLATVTAQMQRCRYESVARGDGFNFGSCSEVTLFGQRIGDSGVERLVAALSGNTRLKFLDLWNNGIGPTGAAALGKMLETNSALEKLLLNENPVGCGSELRLWRSRPRRVAPRLRPTPPPRPAATPPPAP